MPAQGYTPQTGDPIDDKKRTLGDILGTVHRTYPDPKRPTKTKTLPAKVFNATFEDLMQSQGWFPPNGKPQNPKKLKTSDLTELKEAIAAKTGWTYQGPPSACCSCIG